ncbi:MAG TPA: emp24/gp25L/p24 family protein [Candidatus Bathyarchaeia archaeon]|nr:emp24/gp25L/p24 family protein [Candidatus Bathyarchaeia archaeon]
MPRSACALVFIFLSAYAFFGMIAPVLGDNANFTVQPLKEHTITLSLRETDSVSGSFSAVSNDETGVNFYVTDPFNNTIMHHDDVMQRSFSFTANANGDYQLHFDNSLSSAHRKTVSLNYTVTSYIMGMPQEQFLFLFIAAVALIGIVLYVALMPK